MKKESIIHAITASRLIFAAAAAAVLVIWHAEPVHLWTVWVAMVCVGLSEISDLADGYLARKWSVVSSFGKFFDPYADSTSRLIVFWALAVTGKCWVIVPLVMAVRDITVAYGRVAMTAAGKDVSARLTGKLKAVFQGCAAFGLIISPLFYVWIPGTEPLKAWINGAFSIIVIAITLISLADYLSAAWPYLKKNEE